MLQKEFPNLRIDLIIKNLHAFFHADCRQKDEHSKGDSNINNNKSKETITLREKEADCMPIAARFTHEQAIATAFINHGYGLRVLR